MPGNSASASGIEGDRAAARSACAAPTSALYLRPDGYVAACCGSWHLLGRVTGPERQSLRDIWDGPAAAQLRRAMEASDYGLGCWECGQEVAAGRRRTSLAATFDRYGDGDPRGPRMIDFAMSNRCNLQCVMCNGGLSSAIRRHREGRPPMPAAYDDRFFDELDEFLPALERAQFKGGEPFLARENRRVWDALLALGGAREVCVTTNGTVWNSNVERYVGDLAMDVILSVDAVDPSTLQRIRVGVDPDRLWRNVDRFQRATRAAGSSLSLCMCLMSTNWQELHPFLVECDRRQVEASVIWVDGPAAFRLLGLDRAELRRAVGHMERQAVAGASLSEPSRAIWEDALARLQVAAEGQGGGEVAVELLPRAGERSLLERQREQLAGVTDVELLELDFHHDVIRAVHAPAWSRWLDPEAWVGTGLEQTMTVLAASAGSTVRFEVEPGPLGLHDASITIGEGPAARRIRACYVPPGGGGQPSRSHILMALVRSSDGNAADLARGAR